MNRNASNIGFGLMIGLALALAPAASATLDIEIVPVVNASGIGDPHEPDFSPITHHTFDVLVMISDDPSGGGDDWTAGMMEAQLLQGTFFQAGLGGDVPPEPDVIEISPATAFDSYYSAPGYDSGFMEFAHSRDTSTSLDTAWFDTCDSGLGTYQVTRFTIVLPEDLVATLTPPAVGSLVGTFETAHEHLVYGFEWIAFDIYAVCRGDLDGDGEIGLADLAALLANYGVTVDALHEDGDLDGDGDVDLADLAALLAAYGTICE